MVTFLGRTQKKENGGSEPTRENHVRLPVRLLSIKRQNGSFGSIRRFYPDLVVRNRRVDKTTRKGLAGPIRTCVGPSTARVLLAGRRARAVREVRRHGDGDRGERPLGATRACTTVAEQEREAAQSYNRIGGFSSQILCRRAAVSVGTTRARKRRTYATTHTHEKYINEVRMSRDDKYVLSAAGDGIGVWDVETLGDDWRRRTGRREGRIDVRRRVVNDDEDEDNNTYRFVSSGADKMVKLWKVKDVVRERQVGVDVEIVEILKKQTTKEKKKMMFGWSKPKTEQHVAKHVTLEDAYSCCGAETTVDDMQIGVCASAETVVSCGLSGKMTVLDVVVVDEEDEFGERKKKKQLRFREEIF